MTVWGRIARMGTTLIAAIAIGLAVAGPALGAATPKEIPLSTALDLLESGTAQSALLEGGPGSSSLVVRVDGVNRVTALPSGLTERVIDAAQKGGVPLRVRVPAADPAEIPSTGGGFDVEYFVQTWGPLILLAGLVIVSALALRMAGGARFRHQVRAVRSAHPLRRRRRRRRDPRRGRRDLRGPPRPGALRGGRGDAAARASSSTALPGTGKTLLARAVAGEAGVPFFSASGSEFVEVYSGLGSKRVRALFAAARKEAPAVVYIDEIDAVGGRRTGHASAGEREQTLDQLLAEMDGFAADPGQAGRGARLDQPAGRPRPGPGARRPLRPQDRRRPARTRGAPRDPRRPPARPARSTPGVELPPRSPPSPSAWPAPTWPPSATRPPSRPPARAPTRLSIPHFRQALMRLAAGPERRGRLMSDDERLLVAYHEMGHAIVGHMSPHCDPVERVTVIPQGQALGVTVSLPTEDRFLATRGECVERLAMMMAGRAAEELVFGEFTSGAADDLQRAATLARRMVEELGMGAATTRDSLEIGLPGAQTSDATDRGEAAARSLIEEAFETATRLLRDNLHLLHESAHSLVGAEALERDDLATLLGPRPEARRLDPGSVPSIP